MNQPKTHAIRQGRYYYHSTAIRTKVFSLSLSLSLSLCLLIGMIGIGELAWGQTTDVYPKPVSEYAEQTGPGQMTFLAYPKYYRNANNQLTEVNTTLSVSSDPDWDYEVTSGIWSLSVRKDGTFQARHAGDTFTYQFDSLGIDRGSGFQPLDLGKANFSQMSVAGDTITWQNVVAGVDLKVRYIHDILKVDIVVKKETMGRIKTSAQRGELNPDTYLTALPLRDWHQSDKSQGARGQRPPLYPYDLAENRIDTWTVLKKFFRFFKFFCVTFSITR